MYLSMEDNMSLYEKHLPTELHRGTSFISMYNHITNKKYLIKQYNNYASSIYAITEDDEIFINAANVQEGWVNVIGTTIQFIATTASNITKYNKTLYDSNGNKVPKVAIIPKQRYLAVEVAGTTYYIEIGTGSKDYGNFFNYADWAVKIVGDTITFREDVNMPLYVSNKGITASNKAFIAKYGKEAKLLAELTGRQFSLISPNLEEAYRKNEEECLKMLGKTLIERGPNVFVPYKSQITVPYITDRRV
jgi:hypothetical protein